MPDMSSPRDWLENEDRICFEDRLTRLQWLAERTSAGRHWLFHGGFLAQELFEEARYCFVYGQFLATIHLGLAYLEITLAALIYGIGGRDDLERASLATLLKEAVKQGWLTNEESQGLERVRNRRNAVTHFRKPLHPDTIERRAVISNQLPEDVVAQDAAALMDVALQMVAKNAV